MTLARLIGGFRVLDHESLKTKTKNFLDHVDQLLLTCYMLDFGQLDPIANLNHVFNKKLSSLPNGFVHQVFSVE